MATRLQMLANWMELGLKATQIKCDDGRMLASEARLHFFTQPQPSKTLWPGCVMTNPHYLVCASAIALIGKLGVDNIEAAYHLLSNFWEDNPGHRDKAKRRDNYLYFLSVLLDVPEHMIQRISYYHANGIKSTRELVEWLRADETTI